MKTNTPTAWEKMRAGKTADAICHMQEDFQQNRDSSHMMSLGIGYLWIRDYQSAWEHFHQANSERPYHADAFYAMAGVAKWCLGERAIAVSQWRDGVCCEFSDPSSVGISLLLFFASIVEPNMFSRADAERLMAERLELAQATLWPGALAQHILGRISATELDVASVGNHEDETMIRHWLTDFYRGILAYDGGDLTNYEELMRKTADTSRPEWNNMRFFFSAIWSEEFFLARHEASSEVRPREFHERMNVKSMDDWKDASE